MKSDKQQPTPVHNDLPSAHDLVIEDFKVRKEFGLRKYGTILQAYNSRHQLLDAYQEILDLTVYLRLVLFEEENKIINPPPFPWQEPPLDQWSIVGMNHYGLGENKYLFIAMAKGNHLIKAEGRDEQYLFRNLAEQAREIEGKEKGEAN